MNNKQPNKIWVDANELIELDGNSMADFEINGNGYLAKLKAFIAKRDMLLKQQENSKKAPEMEA